MATKTKTAARLTGKSLGRPEGSSGIKTRARLLQIAATLFAKNGFTGVTMADVAGAAGLTAPSIYNHFSSKDELFIATVMNMYEEISLGFSEAAAADGPWRVKIERMLTAAAELYRDDSVLQRLGAVAQVKVSHAPDRYAAIAAAQDDVDQVFRDVIGAALAAGELPESIDAALAGDLLAAMVTVAIARVTHKRPSHADFQDIITTFETLFLQSPPLSAEIVRGARKPV